MMLVTFVRAVITRALFVLVSLVGVWRVTWVKGDPNYWSLIVLCLPLIVEMIITLKRRSGQDYKWFSPSIFLFLISIIPCMWLLELHHQDNRNTESKCKKLNSWESLRGLVTVNTTGDDYSNLTALQVMRRISDVCSNDWILGLHQVLLILLIVGKWLLPRGGGVTQDELSQLLLTFVGTAADILEFTNETLADIKDSSNVLVYVVLVVWTLSIFQFPVHLSADNTSEEEPDAQKWSLLVDIWPIMEALLFQDGPFLLVRLTVMTYYKVYHQMLGFFTIKNLLVVALNLYRLVAICQKVRRKEDVRKPGKSRGEDALEECISTQLVNSAAAGK